MVTPLLRIIRPSSREQGDMLAPRLEALRSAGFDVLYDDLPADPTWLYASSTARDRAAALVEALREPRTTAVVAARGGYGASDLLPLLPWDELKRMRPKLLVGFSDVSALHTALYAKLGWGGLHAPMPATTLWGTDGDVESLLAMLQAHARGEGFTGGFEVEHVGGPKGPVTGKLFGGCFTVITNLIGTPFAPRSLAGHVVFIEDTDEHPARLMRAFNQWQQSGFLDGVKALLVGYLRRLGENIDDCASFVYEEFARRSGLPVYMSRAFGHVSPNAPLLLGAEATIDEGRLGWRSIA